MYNILFSYCCVYFLHLVPEIAVIYCICGTTLKQCRTCCSKCKWHLRLNSWCSIRFNHIHAFVNHTCLEACLKFNLCLFVIQIRSLCRCYGWSKFVHTSKWVHVFDIILIAMWIFWYTLRQCEWTIKWLLWY